MHEAGAQRTALITGGSRGIGRAIAERLLADGLRIVLTGRHAERLAQAVEELGGSAQGVAGVALDLTDRAGLQRGIEALAAAAGQVDVLVNNAGIAPGAPLHRTDDATWDRVMQLNAHAPFALCRAFVPAMVERGGGRVVQIASIAGLTGVAYTSAYCASKHALVGLTRALAMELATTGVTVNAVCPGWVETDMAAAAIERIERSTGRDAEAARASLERMSPQRRFVRPDEVAGLVSWLCSDAAGAVTGQAWSIDGGTVMR
jgi:3-hydroxybutyrate dehydrogenase